MQHFEKLGVNLTPESIYMKDIYERHLFMKDSFLWKAFIYIFWTNQNLTILRKCPVFFKPTASTNIKIYKANFEAGCSYKDCNQFIF